MNLTKDRAAKRNQQAQNIAAARNSYSQQKSNSLIQSLREINILNI
jgi:hypothetical protein